MKSKAPLALMEQIVMLLVFALAAALCLQAFVKADALSANSEARDKAVVICQDAAELIRYQGGEAQQALAAAAAQLNATFTEGVLEQVYDENWQPNQDGRRAYLLRATVDESPVPGLAQATVQVQTRQGQSLFELTVAWQEVTADADA